MNQDLSTLRSTLHLLLEMYNDPTGMLSQSFINEILNSPSGTSWTNNGNGFTNNWGGMMDYDGGAQNYRSYSLAEQHNSIDGGGGVAGEIVLPPLHMTVPKSYQGNIALTMISFSMGFQQHLAKYLGHFPQFIDPLAGVRNDGPIQYIGGAGDITGIFQVGGIILAANSDGNANYILAALMITRSGNTGNLLKILNAEKGIISEGSQHMLAHYYPINGGAMGKWSNITLQVGSKIDRFGSNYGKYFSNIGTPMEMRALPPGNTGAYTAFEVLKPFMVQTSNIAPAFGKMGTGVQYYSPFLNLM